MDENFENNSTRQAQHWILCLIKYYIYHLLYVKVFSCLAGNTLEHEWNWDCMELGLRFPEIDFILFYIIFTLRLCLFFIYLCICYFILFTSRHIPLPLFCKCISNHANIWYGASLRNCQRYLAIGCRCRELHLGRLRWLKSNKFLPFDLSFYCFIDK